MVDANLEECTETILILLKQYLPQKLSREKGPRFFQETRLFIFST